MDYASLVRSIIAGQLDIASDDIQGESQIMEDLGADSLDVVEMLMQLEDTIGISIPDEDILRLRTVDGVVAYLCDVQRDVC